MLDYSRMYRIARRSITAIGLAFLTLSTSTFPVSAALREEAVSYREQGYEAQQRGDKATALSFYQKAAMMDPAYPAPHNDIGVLLEEQGRLGEAEQAYQGALQINPDYLEAHANLAMLYERMGRTDQAIEHWMKRYELGDANDAWTARAEERLIALGAMTQRRGSKGTRFNRKQALAQERQDNEASVNEFRAVTDNDGPWP